MKTTSGYLALLLSLTFLLFCSFDHPVPELLVTSVEKTTCRMIRPGKIRQEVYLNLDGPNITHFGGQVVYYFFYDTEGNFVEKASATVGPNPQIVTVTKLTGGVAYGIIPQHVNEPPGNLAMDLTFTAQFPCKKKLTAPVSTGQPVKKRKNY